MRTTFLSIGVEIVSTKVGGAWQPFLSVTIYIQLEHEYWPMTSAAVRSPLEWKCIVSSN